MEEKIMSKLPQDCKDMKRKHHKPSTTKRSKTKSATKHSISRILVNNQKVQKVEKSDTRKAPDKQFETNLVSPKERIPPSNHCTKWKSPVIQNDIIETEDRRPQSCSEIRKHTKAMKRREARSAKPCRYQTVSDDTERAPVLQVDHEYDKNKNETDTITRNKTDIIHRPPHNIADFESEMNFKGDLEVNNCINVNGKVDRNVLKVGRSKKLLDKQVNVEETHSNDVACHNIHSPVEKQRTLFELTSQSGRNQRPTSTNGPTRIVHTTRSKSAPHTRISPSKSSFEFIGEGSFQRYSARQKIINKTINKTKDYEATKAAESKLSSLTIKNVTFNSLSEVLEFDEVDDIDTKKATGKPCAIASRTGTTSTFASEKQLLSEPEKSSDTHNQNEFSIDLHTRPSSCMTEISQNKTETRGSSLMLGSGMVRKATNDLETLELHFEKGDYNNLVSHRSTNMFCITGSAQSRNECDSSPRPVEIPLPKTYITRSGSLFLYSDSKVIKDKQKEVSDDSPECNRNIEVQGRKMSPRTLVPQAYPYWGKLVNSKKGSSVSENRSWNNTGCSKKDQREYIGLSRSDPLPYLWNYTFLPVKLINAALIRDIKTVSNLSEAALAYRSRCPTTEDKYLSMMEQTRYGKTQAECLLERVDQLRRPSSWTAEWIRDQPEKVCGEKTTAKRMPRVRRRGTGRDVIARHWDSFHRTASCRTPVNTPLVVSKEQEGLHPMVGPNI